MNAKGKKIFDDLGLQFFKKYNNEVFEKWGATILFKGIRDIFKHLGGENVINMDNPPIQREIKKGVVSEINRKKIQKEEVNKSQVK